MTIDFFGRCANITCNTECFKHKTKNHRFYLSFENSFCNEYVTEKFWRFNELVPVVLSRRYYPKLHPESFIALDDFSSLQAAAEYLNYLQKNDSAYVDHLMWTYTHRREFIPVERALCKICNYVISRNTSTPQVYHRIEEYQNRTSTCDLGYQLRWLKPRVFT
ncbi:unnamed protein product [Bursaphelenchus xylophilus]|uniref:Fucosyltransferase n=1 Tax=Bursaphelenchus xylophilus TaxID=6326 RepID=A0A1I7RXS3_BURXY|nr:unnamed protein product [Bursaphelenchus xylophilus]CAG9126693.1 unnamed protein product [Bursaphelenchus xylophilus]